MEESGYLLFVLQAHLPFVRHPEFDYPLEENWLFEAITESYIPLHQTLSRLVRDETNFAFTLSFSPTLISMLSDPLLRQRYRRYLTERTLLAEKECARLQSASRLRPLAQMYRERFAQSREAFEEFRQSDLISAFKMLSESGKVDILASSAGHAYLPLWEHYPRVVAFQIRLGIEQYRKSFAMSPLGFWLPECGYYPALDTLLGRAGLKYFFLDAHGITNGYPRPRFREYAPVHCPSGVAAFGRDWLTHDLVWLKDKGYPGDPFYRDYSTDIGFELSQDYLSPFTHTLSRVPTGIKYLSASGDVYDPQAAFSRCDAHANHFIESCRELIVRLHTELGRRPVVVALFDAEHFGHWWHEGAMWLNLVIRKLAYDQSAIKLVTARDYLEIYSTNQIVAPSMSSWGYQGYNESWLMGRNAWIYPRVFEMIELLDSVIAAHPTPRAEIRDALNQYLRELLLAQSSDWAFMMHTQTTQEYAIARINEHLEHMSILHQQLAQNRIDGELLQSLRDKNNIFPDTDLLEIYLAEAPRV
jgi:1,4-alpha-glucan branching enzyme